MAVKRTETRAHSGKRRALCVGINDYPFEGSDLNGCVNDAKAWATLFTQKFQFPSTDVKLILDNGATKKNVMDSLKQLLTGAKAGDVLVFSNSSHGSYVADTSGDEERYDEIICPYDIDQNQIVDDDLRTLIAGIDKNVRLTVILDNCFSGTATRAAVSEIIPGMRTPDDRRIRFLSPALRGEPVLQNPWKAKPNRAQKYPESKMTEVLLTGCTDREYSYDASIGGKYHGAMTYYAIQAIQNAGYDLTYSQLHSQLGNLIVDYPQHPQLEGKTASKKRRVFV